MDHQHQSEFLRPGDGAHAHPIFASTGEHMHNVGIAPRSQPTAAPALVDDNTVTLDTPIRRGDTTIAQITLRRPKAGELRGIALTDLLQLDVTALQTVLPRISAPTLLKQDVAELDPADLVQLGTRVAGFLLPRSALADGSPSA